MAENTPAAETVLAGTPPLTRIEHHRCPLCDGWIDPAEGYLEKPYTHPMDCGMGRFLYLYCTGHGCGAWLFDYRFGGAGYSLAMAPTFIAPELRPAIKLAFEKRDGDHAPSVRLFQIGKGHTFKK